MLVALVTTACAGPSTRSLSAQVGISPGPAVEAAPPARDGQPRPPAGTWQGVVTRVTDGDTLRVEVTVAAPGSPPVGADVPVRLLRIDTPELGRGDQPVECLAEEARLALRALAPEGATLFLAHDVERRDRFDRELAHLWTVDGTWVNGALVAGGYATVVTFPPNVAFTDEVLAAERAARDAGIGLWDPSVC